MAFASLFTLLDDITAVLDDVAMMTKVAAKKPPAWSVTIWRSMPIK